MSRWTTRYRTIFHSWFTRPTSPYLPHSSGRTVRVNKLSRHQEALSCLSFIHKHYGWRMSPRKGPNEIEVQNANMNNCQLSTKRVSMLFYLYKQFKMTRYAAKSKNHILCPMFFTQSNLFFTALLDTPPHCPVYCLDVTGFGNAPCWIRFRKPHPPGPLAAQIKYPEVLDSKTSSCASTYRLICAILFVLRLKKSPLWHWHPSVEQLVPAVVLPSGLVQMLVAADHSPT